MAFVLSHSTSTSYSIAGSWLSDRWLRSVRAFWARHHLTAQERANLRASCTPLGVVSASTLGAGLYYR